jgi:ATP-dependent Clp protease ATP-binding subunit ClpA
MSEFSSNQSSLIKTIIDSSFQLAIGLDQTTITTEHILYVLTQNSKIKDFLNEQGIDTQKLLNDIFNYLKSQTHLLKNQIFNENPDIMTGQITASVQTLIVDSVTEARKENREVESCDIFKRILANTESYASYFMSKYGINEEMIKKMSQTPNCSNTSSSLDEYCINLNEKVKKDYDILVGREKELFDIAHTLAKKKKSNVLIVGDPGVGKSQIVEGLAYNINLGNVPKILKDKIIFSLDVGGVLAGCRYRGDFEEKIKNIIAGLVANPKAILFVDEAHQMDAGEGKSQSGVGFSAMLKPELSRGNIKVLAATTWEGYRQTFEKDTALMRRFRVLNIDEPSQEETIAILNGNKISMEKFHHCKITQDAIKAAVELTGRYQADRKFPDKAIDVIDSACARTQVMSLKKKIVNRESIVSEVSEITGVHIKDTDSKTSMDILTIGSILKNKVFHQDKAIDSVAEGLIIAQSGLRDPNKPIGSYVFTGPSGVGKTFLAKQIANNMSMTLLKYDMSEFQEKHTLARLIGAPPGYVGFGDGGTGEGQLINDIIKNPNSVILFDEMEKAHPDIFTILLQLLDDGKITGTTGKVADCRNSIVVMCSNLGSKENEKLKLGFNSNATGKSETSKAVDSFMLTELRGRITGIVEFNKLDDISLRRIVNERILDIESLIKDKNIKLVPTENLIDHILSLNTDSKYGARKIAKIVDSTIKYPLSVQLLTGNIINGSTVNLDWFNNDLVISHSISTVKIMKKLSKPVI